MSDTVIRIENLGKCYRLGEVGARTLRDDIARQWARLRGLDDPLSGVDDLSRGSSVLSGNFWALKGLDLEVSQGEVLGLVGANGAGKSTLLKLLSRITAPTTGRIRAKGRIASLLEVGTGFHDELTGRENIFMNGAVMGMRRHEIASQLDKIIEFSGCGPYIDTPVKRYSSGMFVRLGFAVAAHLQSEILIVDEVLAVGDKSFQDRCISKMRSMALTGDKTILFVSHDLSSVRALCHSGAVIRDGKAEKFALASDAINNYLALTSSNDSIVNYPKREGGPYISSISIDKERASKGDVVICLQFASPVPFRPHPGIVVSTNDMRPIIGSNGSMHDIKGIDNLVTSGTFRCEFNNLPLHEGAYRLSVWLGDASRDYDEKYAALGFEFQPMTAVRSKPAVDVIGPLNITPAWSLEPPL